LFHGAGDFSPKDKRFYSYGSVVAVRAAVQFSLKSDRGSPLYQPASSSSSAQAVRGFGTGCGSGPRCPAMAIGLVRSNQPWQRGQRAKLSASNDRGWAGQLRRSDMSASPTRGAARSLAFVRGSTPSRRLSFQPGFGLCQFAKRACEPPHGVAFRTRRHCARLADDLEGGMTVGKGTAEEQQIAHGSTPIIQAVIMVEWT
jgi:hypothetical protein